MGNARLRDPRGWLGLSLILALAGSAMAQSEFMPAVAAMTMIDPDHTLMVSTSTATTKDAIQIRALASNSAVTQIVVRGDGVPIQTCAANICYANWTKAAMAQRKCVSCEVLVTATEGATGRTYRVKTEVIRP